MNRPPPRTRPVASLQMYWMPEIADAVAAWWTGLRAHLVAHGVADAPAALAFPDDIHSIWHETGLVLSQTCGGPLITELGDTVRVVGTPIYDVPMADDIDYRSAVIVHCDNPARDLVDLRGSRAAINGRESFSGYHALRALLADTITPGEPFFGDVLVSGAHHLSLRAVAEGDADCAAIDAVCFAGLRNLRPAWIDRVRVLTQTAPAPGLPYITSGHASDDRLEKLREGVEAAFADPALAETRQTLFLGGFRRTDVADYAPVAAAIAKGRDVIL